MAKQYDENIFKITDDDVFDEIKPATAEQPKSRPEQKSKPAKKTPTRKTETKTSATESIDKIVIPPPKKEIKMVQKSIRVTQTLSDRIDEKCKELGVSYNEAANQLFKAWVGMKE